jgi:hypothetical protein
MSMAERPETGLGPSVVGGCWTCGELAPGWLACELRAAERVLRHWLPLGRIVARRRLRGLPAHATSASLVEGETVRVRGTIGFGPVEAVTPHLAMALVRTVEEGGDLPDFWLHLADGVSIAVAAGAAAKLERLQVLDCWEDRQSRATCDERTPRLFRQVRFRPGQPVEVAGLAIRTLDPDQPGARYRVAGLGWMLLPGRYPLTVSFTALTA